MAKKTTTTKKKAAPKVDEPAEVKAEATPVETEQNTNTPAEEPTVVRSEEPASTPAPVEESLPDSELAQVPTMQEVAPNGDWMQETINFKEVRSLKQLNYIAAAMAQSGMFDNIKSLSTAMVQIMAGQEIGVTPFQAVTNIHIIKGKATMAANLMAAKVKSSGKYDYVVEKMSPTECEITFYELHTNGQKSKIGVSGFTAEEARKAGTQNMDKFPRNMLFARAMSNGTKWYCPDVFNGNLVYTPEEMGAVVNAEGEVIEGETVPKAPAPSAPEPAPEQQPEGEPDYSNQDPETELPVIPPKKASGLPDPLQITLLRQSFESIGYGPDDTDKKKKYCMNVIGKDVPSNYDEYMLLLESFKQQELFN